LAFRFVLDENVPAEVGEVLQKDGHVVVWSRGAIGRKSKDRQVAELAKREAAMVVTWDRADFQRLLTREPDDGKTKPFDPFSLIAFRCEYEHGAARVLAALPYIQLAFSGTTAEPRVRVLVESTRICIYDADFIRRTKS
jgi:predicted nuclease of predicted toxin-antitoxin system